MRVLIIVFLAFFSANTDAKDISKNKYETPSLCTAQDTIFFSCKTNKLKTLSLCGKKNKDTLSRLYYRFGKTNKIEFEYPDSAVNDKNSLRLFYYNHYTRWFVNYYTITFRNHAYIYVLQDLRNMEGNGKGEEGNVLHVTQNILVYDNPEYDGAIAISCASDVISDIRPLVSVIPCAEENALGCKK